MMVIYLPVKFEFDSTNRFRVRVQKQKFGGQTNGQKTDKQTDRITPKCKQEGQRCPKRWIAQAAIRLATAVITFRN